MPNPTARYDARDALERLRSLGAERVYVEEYRDGTWILRYGGSPVAAERFLEYSLIAQPLRVRPRSHDF
jgi:hypothetical protein